MNKSSSSSEPCLIKLEAFEGPLDLLIYLIKKNEVDIYDIPIALITEQYLNYLELMKELNLEVVGDYLVMAAELGQIKSNMLLPKPEPENMEEDIDPRGELVRRLIEYQRYKEAASKLLDFQILERDVFIRACQEEEYQNDVNSLVRADLWSLVDALRDIYKRRNYSWPEAMQFDLETLSLDDKMEDLKNTIRLESTVLFEDLFTEASSHSEFILTFLAILELVKTSVIGAFQDMPYASIRLVYLGEQEFGSPIYQEGN
jgi:segregation and condensation protein A